MLIFWSYYSFDLQLESFGVDPNEFKQAVPSRIFNAFIEPWEEENRKKNDCVVEQRFLTKYGGLRMYLPDNNKIYTIALSNCQFYLGKDNGWMLIGEDEDGELEPFAPSLCIELITNTPQDSGVRINAEDERKMPAIMC